MLPVLIDIAGGIMLAGAAGWVLARLPNPSINKRRYLGVELEALVLSAATIGGVLAFLLARHV